MDFFKDNLINWLILVAALMFLWNKFMPGVMGERRRRIQTAIDDAARAKQEGEEFLASQRQRIANAEKEAENILIEAKQTAERMKQQMLEDTKRDAASLEQKLQEQIAAHRQLVITQLRSQVAMGALRMAETELQAALSDNVKKGLQDRFVSQLSRIGGDK